LADAEETGGEGAMDLGVKCLETSEKKAKNHFWAVMKKPMCSKLKNKKEASPPFYE